MNGVLLVVLLVVCVVGALFTTIIALGAYAVCELNKKDIREIRGQLDAIDDELAKVGEFNGAVTDCISGIGNALDIINGRTNWLDGLDSQISGIYGQNKDRKES